MVAAGVLLGHRTCNITRPFHARGPIHRKGGLFPFRNSFLLCYHAEIKDRTLRMDWSLTVFQLAKTEVLAVVHTRLPGLHDTLGNWLDGLVLELQLVTARHGKIPADKPP